MTQLDNTRDFNTVAAISPIAIRSIPTKQELEKDHIDMTIAVQHTDMNIAVQQTEAEPQPEQQERVYVYDINKQPIVYTQTRTRIKTVNEKHLCPSVPKALAVIILLLNIILPGVGTIIVGCHSNEPAYYVLTGLAQLCLAIIVFGWIWAILTGMQVLAHSY
jgi:hypothetical protein